MQRSASCRTRRELSNEYLLAKIGVDTAENAPSKVWPACLTQPATPPDSIVTGPRGMTSIQANAKMKQFKGYFERNAKKDY